MTRARALKKLARDLKKLAEVADDHDLELANGALVGSLLNNIAYELELEVEREVEA